jgi:hypothetical protein
MEAGHEAMVLQNRLQTVDTHLLFQLSIPPCQSNAFLVLHVNKNPSVRSFHPMSTKSKKQAMCKKYLDPITVVKMQPIQDHQKFQKLLCNSAMHHHQ